MGFCILVFMLEQQSSTFPDLEPTDLQLYERKSSDRVIRRKKGSQDCGLISGKTSVMGSRSKELGTRKVNIRRSVAASP